MSLYPFQQEGVDWLTNAGLDSLRNQAVYLADEMGLGKTVQAAVAAQGRKRALVVGPASVLPNWHEVWPLWNQETELVTTSYSKLVRNGLSKYTGMGADLVILDEAHYCKTPSAKRTRLALDLARRAQLAYLLSGTPMPNDPTELYAPIRVLWPEICRQFGITRLADWRNTFTKWYQSPWGPKSYATKNADLLRPWLRRVMLRRTIKDVALELPPLRVDLHLLRDDDGLDRALQEGLGLDPAALRAEMAAIEMDEDGSHSRLRRLLGTLKAPKIAKVLTEELADLEYEKLVVLAYHHDTLAVLRHQLEPFGVVGFDGSTPAGERQEAINRFTHDPSARVFVAQQTAAGVGINLQVAHEIVLVEPDWTPAVNRQAIKRVHRIGSKDPVRARLFAVEGSLDASVMRTLVQKTQMLRELEL